MQVEGIPDGWELVRVGKPLPREHYIDVNGCVFQASESMPTALHWHLPVIRKKPKRYRPFANAAEADELWNAVLKSKNPDPELEDSKFRVNHITTNTVGIGHGSYSYRVAFESFECIDGTPFGVEVTE